MNRLEFEKPILDLEGKIAELRGVGSSGDLNISDEVGRLQIKVDKLLKTTYAKLTAQQKVQVARHPDRPHFLDYARQLFQEFTPLAGDRLFGDDQALIGGLARFNGRSVVLIGHEKGSDTQSRIRHNFGMAKPEGYRKAQRLMHMADQFQMPVVTLVDTAGAFPGVQAEERGQAEAIAKSIETCLQIKVPIVSIVIGEGGSGGAIAIAAADRVYMLEHSIYSVISPEGCASILWRDASHAQDASAALKLTAQDLLSLKLIDGIIPEPVGGAHRQRDAAIAGVGLRLEKALKELSPWQGDKLLAKRFDKFTAMGRAA